MGILETEPALNNDAVKLDKWRSLGVEYRRVRSAFCCLICYRMNISLTTAKMACTVLSIAVAFVAVHGGNSNIESTK